MPRLQACSNGVLLTDPTEARLRSALATDALVWLDLEAPAADEAHLLQRLFGFDTLALHNALHAHERSRIETYEDHYALLLYAVQPLGSVPFVFDLRPLHVFVGKNYLVTLHPDPIPQIESTLRRWQAPDTPLESRPGELLYALLDTLLDDDFALLDRVAEEVDDLEDRLFEPGSSFTTQHLFRLKKQLLAFRRAVAPERDVLNVLLRREHAIFHPNDTPYLQDLYDHTVRVLDTIDLYRDLLSSALDSYLSLQSNRLNEVVKILTVASIILMACALVAGIYGMNFQHMPELAWPHGYPMALLLMVAISGGLLLFFRHQRWL